MGIEAGPTASGESSSGAEGASSIDYGQLYREANPGSHPVSIEKARVEAHAAAPAMDRALELEVDAENIVASVTDAGDPVSPGEKAEAVDQVRALVHESETQRAVAALNADEAGQQYDRQAAQLALVEREEASKNALLRGRGLRSSAPPPSPAPGNEGPDFDPLENVTWR
jgi:hypothetical protein